MCQEQTSDGLGAQSIVRGERPTDERPLQHGIKKSVGALKPTPQANFIEQPSLEVLAPA
jgi:hypothetical protein